MILYKEVDRSYFKLYDKVSMNVDVHSEYQVVRIDNGLGGLILEERQVKPYIKDLSQYACAAEYEKEFDITNWRFYMAFDDETPVGAMTVARKTEGMHTIWIRKRKMRYNLCGIWI